jgi:hypothetical protein
VWLLFIMAASLGLALLVAAGVFYFKRSIARAERVKLVRGMTILDQLDDLACDYYYNEKDKVNDGHLPDAAWEPFRKLAAGDDVFDCIIMTAKGASDQFADALYYKEGKAKNGESLVFQLGRYEDYGPPGLGQNPEKAKVRVIEGHVQVGGAKRPVLFFRRAILHPKLHTTQWFGHAVVVIFRDVPSPDSSGAIPVVQPLPASGAPGNPEEKSATAPAATESRN